MPEKQDIESILKILDKSKQIDEFVKALPQILQLFKELKQHNLNERAGLTQSWQSSFAALKAEVNKIVKGQDGANGSNGIDGKTPTGQDLLKLIHPLIPKVKDGKDGRIGKDGRAGKDAIFDSSKLEERLKRLESRPVGGWSAASGGKIIQAYDLSSQLNGVLKIFSLPAFWRVVQVISSSTPNAFRPTVDYTTDASTMTITFTSQIAAGSTLATGQTLIVLYATP